MTTIALEHEAVDPGPAVDIGVARAELAIRELGIPAESLVLIPYQVDTDFWCPQPVGEERLVCSAGSPAERRDAARPPRFAC